MGGDGGLPVTEQLAVTLADWLPGKPAEGHALHCSFNKTSHWLGLGQVYGWVSPYCRV